MSSPTRRSRDRANAYEANHPHCRNNCGTRVYWRDGHYCYACRVLPIRHCEAGHESRTLGRTCLWGCETPLPVAPIFGLDHIEPQPWCPAWPLHPRGSYVYDAAAWTRFIKEAQKQVAATA